MISIFWLIIVALVLILAWIVFGYNNLVALRNRAKEAFADVDIQLKRRHDLIPNLIETVKSYASHEKEVFEKVLEARTKAMGVRENKDLKEITQAENYLSQTLKSLFAIAENYPDLKASQNFLELQKELTDTEDKIMAARRFYNANVRDLNIAIESFPTNIIASIFGFKKMDFFEISAPEEKETPSVKF